MAGIRANFFSPVYFELVTTSDVITSKLERLAADAVTSSTGFNRHKPRKTTDALKLYRHYRAESDTYCIYHYCVH